MDLSLTKLPWYAQVGAFVVLALRRRRRVLLLLRDADRAPTWTSRQTQLTSLARRHREGPRRPRRSCRSSARRSTTSKAGSTNLRAVLPEEKDAADLLRRMQTVATQSNLTIKSFKPAPVVTKQLHAEWPITLELDGTYHNLAHLLRPRRQVHAHRQHQRRSTCKGTDTARHRTRRSRPRCVATTFVLLDKPTEAAPIRGRGARAAAGEEGELVACVCPSSSLRCSMVSATGVAGADQRRRLPSPTRRPRRSRPPSRQTRPPCRRAGRRLHLRGRRPARSVPEPARHRAPSRATTVQRGDGPAGLDGRRDLGARRHAEPRRADRDGAGARQQDLHRAPGRQAARRHDQGRDAAGARHRAGSQRSAVARETAGGPQAAAIARGRQE